MYINIRDIVMSHAVNGTTMFVTALISIGTVTAMLFASAALRDTDWQEPLLSIAAETLSGEADSAF